MTRVLVAGATGYLGRFVAREFKERGDWVRVLARNPDKLRTPGPFLEPPIADLVDEVFVGEVTKPETLRGLCEGIDVVFSSIGITRQTERLSYMDVDYRGNRNLLDRAVEASVRKFIFNHVFHSHLLQSLEVIKAKEKFIGELRKTGMEYAIVCPTGLFNDMSEFLGMARKGTVYQIGDGQKKLNPIHGADLAKLCADPRWQPDRDSGRRTHHLHLSGNRRTRLRRAWDVAKDPTGASVDGEAPRLCPGVDQHKIPRHGSGYHDDHTDGLHCPFLRDSCPQGVLRGTGINDIDNNRWTIWGSWNQVQPTGLTYTRNKACWRIKSWRRNNQTVCPLAGSTSSPSTLTPTPCWRAQEHTKA